MNHEEMIKKCGKLLSEIHRCHCMEPFVSFEAIEIILEGFSKLTLEQKAEFATGMLKYLNSDYSEGEMVLKSRGIMAEVLGKLES